MGRLREITVFSIGNSAELKTWSNVPFFFTKSLEDKNIKVNRVNIEENAALALIYKYTIYAFIKLVCKNSVHSYFRSGLNYFLTNIKIRRAIQEYSQSEVIIFLTYSFSAKKYSPKKVVLFSDWSYLYLIRTFLKREPRWFEKKALQREKQHIDTADIVLSLFPKSLAFNIQNYQNPRCHYLGNVINSDHPLDKDQLQELKLNTSKFLFIGNRKYIKGAFDLINAYKELSAQNDGKAELHMIGLKESDTHIKLPGLFYYGYLDKGKPEENKQYYKLISKAKAIVNTTSRWGAFSAMTEAMYYYTPVITSPYGEFVETYGQDIRFGYYVKNNSVEELCSLMQKILSSTEPAYLEMMDHAHEKVKDFTWAAYSDKILHLIS